MQSRRAFIRTVLLASGAVFTAWGDLDARRRHLPARIDSLRTKPAHIFLRDRKRSVMFGPPERDVDYVVVGAGVSGLTAAWRLQKEGKSCAILELEPVTGGAARGGTWHGRTHPVGSGYYVTWDGIYKTVYEDIGMPKIGTGEDAFYYGPDAMIVDPWNDAVLPGLPIPARDKEAFRAFRDELLHFQGLPDYPLGGADPATIAKWDPMPASKYLAKYGSEELTRWMDQYCFSSCGSTVDEVNAYCFLNFYSSEFGSVFDLPRFTSPGGIAGLAAHLRDRVGEAAIRRAALVVSVENAGSGADVRYVDVHGEAHAVHGRAAIVAAQKRIAHTMVVGMPQEQNDLCTQVRYAPYVTVNLLCSGPLFPVRAFDIWFHEQGMLFTDMVDDYYAEDVAQGTADRRTGDFAYCVYCPHPERDRQKLLDERYLAAFAQRVAAEVDRKVPGAFAKIREMRVFAWGHTMVIPSVGSHAQFHPAVSRPIGNIHFANTDNDLSPSVESGVINGYNAAEQALKG